jgi:hypothetical protein
MKAISENSKPRKPHPTAYLHSVKLPDAIPQLGESPMHVQTNFLQDLADTYQSERQ